MEKRGRRWFVCGKLASGSSDKKHYIFPLFRPKYGLTVGKPRKQIIKYLHDNEYVHFQARSKGFIQGEVIWQFGIKCHSVNSETQKNPPTIITSELWVICSSIIELISMENTSFADFVCEPTRWPTRVHPLQKEQVFPQNLPHLKPHKSSPRNERRTHVSVYSYLKGINDPQDILLWDVRTGTGTHWLRLSVLRKENTGRQLFQQNREHLSWHGPNRSQVCVISEPAVFSAAVYYVCQGQCVYLTAPWLGSLIHDSMKDQWRVPLWTLRAADFWGSGITIMSSICAQWRVFFFNFIHR